MPRIMLFADVAVWQPMLGSLVIALAVWAVAREIEVRLVLLLAALGLGLIAGNPQVIIQKFFETFSNEKFIVPICTAMGFAHVLKHTGCDQHLVHLLVKPLTKVRFLLVPGTVLVGFFVNMPVVSQTSTAVTIGAVIIPILQAAKLSPVTIGASLLLGSSIGGELLNPGAPELQTTVTGSNAAVAQMRAEKPAPDGDAIRFTPEQCVWRIIPLNFLGLLIGTLVFWFLSHRYESRLVAQAEPTAAPEPDVFEINWLKAAIPLLPLLFLYLSAYPFELVQIAPDWLQAPPADGSPARLNATRLIGLAMLLGVFAAGLTSPTRVKGVVAAFFEGAGYGYANIISLIVVANCFGTGIAEIGIAQMIGAYIDRQPDLLLPLAGSIPLGFAALCGSGMASAQSLFGFFARPSLDVGIDPTHTGAVVSLAAAAGRTMSPVAAVTLMCANMTGTRPLDLSKQVAIPLLISVAIIIAVAMIIAPAR